MRFVADLHISHATVGFLRSLGHDVIRVGEVLGPAAADATIIEFAAAQGRTILTQDLDFSAIIALSGHAFPSVLSLRLRSSRVERVNEALERVLPLVADLLERGAIVSVEDDRIRSRSLPVEPQGIRG